MNKIWYKPEEEQPDELGYYLVIDEDYEHIVMGFYGPDGWFLDGTNTPLKKIHKWAWLPDILFTSLLVKEKNR